MTKLMKNIKLYLFLILLSVVFIFAMPVKAGVSYSCNYRAYKDCIGSSVYWFDSCANPQDLVQNCLDINRICEYGECAAYYAPAPAPTPTYINRYRVSCYNNNLYWYDSLGVLSGLYKNCADTNQCTEDTCSGSKCQNAIKCDGATCAVGSQDYCNSCNSVSDNFCNCGETSATAPNDCKTNASANSNLIDFNQNQQTASVASVSSSSPAASRFVVFLKRWYLWILIAIVMIFLFIIIFRRLSTNV